MAALKIRSLIHFIVFGAVLIFLIYFGLQYKSSIADVMTRISPLGLLRLILILFLCQVCMSISWAYLIKNISCSLSYTHLIAIWQFSLLGIYLPGSIWNFVGRVYELARVNVSKRVSSYTVALEFIGLLSTGFLIACLTPEIFQKLHLPEQLGLLLLPVPLLLFFPHLLGELIWKVGIRRFDLRSVTSPSVIVLFVFFLGLLVYHMGVGLSLVVMLDVLQLEPAGLHIFNLAGYSAISLITGYMVLIAPNGIGVREGVFVFLLKDHIPLTEAVIVAFALRLLSYLASFIGITWGYLYLKSKSALARPEYLEQIGRNLFSRCGQLHMKKLFNKIAFSTHQLKKNPRDKIPFWNFHLLRLIAKCIYPRYRFKWPMLEWWSEEPFNSYLGKFDKSGSLNDDRRWMLYQLFRLIADVPGDTAECGVYYGASSYLVCQANRTFSKCKRQHYVFDSFEGLSRPMEQDGSHWEQSDLSVGENIVRQNLSEFDNVTYLKGWIPERFVDVESKTFAFVHIDVDLYKPTYDSIAFFYPRLEQGGILLCDDYGFTLCPGARKAIDEFLSDKPEKMIIPSCGGGFFIKGNHTGS